MKGEATTKGARKMQIYLDYLLLDSSKFKLDIYKLRANYHVPKNGYDNKVYTKWLKVEDIIPPYEWYSINFKKLAKLNSDLRSLQLRYALTEHFFDFFIFEYFFFSKSNRILSMLRFTDTCEIRDLFNHRKISNRIKTPVWSKVWKKLSNQHIDTYPISISISPYATINDITDFIRKNKTRIIEYQSKYKKHNIPIGHHRKRISRKRGNFVLKHQELPRKTIAQMANKKFKQNLDGMDVRVAISREKKYKK